MYRTLMFVALAVAAVLGQEARAQQIVATPATYPGRVLICMDAYAKDQAAADKDQAARARVQYGRAVYISQCNRRLCAEARAQNAAVRCR
jgi:hypothetical protein